MKIETALIKSPIGLGDVVKKAMEAVGVKQCGGCAKRQKTFNAYAALVPKRKRLDNDRA